MKKNLEDKKILEKHLGLFLKKMEDLNLFDGDLEVISMELKFLTEDWEF